MASKYPTLLSAFKLGDLTLKNRVVLAPMTRARSGAERVANNLNVEYYTQRANAGLILTEGSHVSEQVCGCGNGTGSLARAGSKSLELPPLIFTLNSSVSHHRLLAGSTWPVSTLMNRQQAGRR